MSITFTERLIATHCWCGCPVGLPENRYDWMLRSSSNQAYCPNGHQFHFTDSLEKKLERERQAHRATRDLLRAEERSHVATRGHLTRQKKRIGNGVCPCCHRHFANVERHMATKHPDFIKES